MPPIRLMLVILFLFVVALLATQIPGANEFLEDLTK